MGEIKYHSSHNIVYSCKYHIVFCPKYRRKVLVNGVDTRLKELVKSICEEIQVDVIEMEIRGGADKKLDYHYAIIPNFCRYSLGLKYPRDSFILT
jgi:putative transposase